MNILYVYVLVIFALLHIVIFVCWFLWKKKVAKQQLAEFNEDNPYKYLSKDQERMLVFGSILACYRREEILNALPQSNLNVYASGLKMQWDIVDSDTAIKTLDDLLNLNRSFVFDVCLFFNDKEKKRLFQDREIAKFFREIEPSFAEDKAELPKIKKQIAEEFNIELQTVEKTCSTYAWDLVRLASLAKWCYWVGYISGAEMWNFMNEGSKKASEIGSSWQDYTISFLLGRTIQGFDLYEMIDPAKQLYHSQSSTSENYKDIDVFNRFDFK